MDKFAQSKRQTGSGFGGGNWLREKLNMPSSYLEGFFKPELDRVMNSLKDLDDRIRSILTGTKIGKSEIGADGFSGKDLLKSARTNFNRREYMAGVSDLGRFHKKIYDITQDVNKFFVDVNKIHHKFLFEGLDDKYKGHLDEFRKHMETTQKKADAESRYFIKEANIMDFFANIGTKRGRSLAAWEKKYPKQTKELREGGVRLLDESQKLLDNTIANLKQMATARATRRPDEYMDIANKIKADFDKFDNGDKGFRAYYNGPIMQWLKIKDEIDASEQKSVLPTETTAPVSSNEGKVELGEDAVSPTAPTVPSIAVPGTPAAPAPVPAQMSPQPVGNVPPLGSGPAVTKSFETEEQAPDTERTKTIMGLGAHTRFYQSLESLSKEDPRILAGYISKYASSIQGTDPDTALELFAIVRKIKG